MPFDYRDRVLHAEDVPLTAIADAVGTPAYVYSSEGVREAARAFRHALRSLPRTRLAFAVKANPNLALLRLLAGEGYGADIVSGGELLHATAAGIAARDVVFSGAGKTRAELVAALDAGVGQFNLEHEEEGVLLATLARSRRRRAAAVLRVNPDVDAGTHGKVTTGRRGGKFGVAIEDAPAVYARLAAWPGLALQGVAVHIGSQVADLHRLEAAYARIGELVRTLRAAGHPIGHVDLGGGLAVAYRPGEAQPALDDYAGMVSRVSRGWDVTLTFEPGRRIVAAAGVLLTRATWVKPTPDGPLVIVDAGMNDLARPALYGAWHEFAAVRSTGGRMVAGIAGPVCESGDTFAAAHELDEVRPGDLAVFRDAGAYGASMASAYNCRAIPPEVLVDGDRFAVVAERVTPAMALAHQRLPNWMAPEGVPRRLAA